MLAALASPTDSLFGEKPSPVARRLVVLVLGNPSPPRPSSSTSSRLCRRDPLAAAFASAAAAAR